jgi:ribosome biogenesis GTPase / thiamine phosphate phosphatase
MSQAQYSLFQLGWKNYFNQQLSIEDLENMQPHRVTHVYRNRLILLGEAGEQDLSLDQYPELIDSTIGDWVMLASGTNDSAKIKPRRLDRLSLFARKSPGAPTSQLIAANVDTAFIVSSFNQDFNLSRIERYLALSKEADATAVLVLTKADQVSAEQQDEYLAKLSTLAKKMTILAVNAKDSTSCEVLNDWCGKGQTVVLLGSSGVGKTSITNTLCSIQELTSEIREDDSKGRHTTTERSLFFTDAGGLILDCPGMRELQLSDCEEGIRAVFSDIEELANDCKFADCHHNNEPGCAVQVAIKKGLLEERRLSNYQKMLEEQARNSLTLAQSHQQDKKLGKLYKSAQTAKRQRLQDES